jgi:hypothetical protein
MQVGQRREKMLVIPSDLREPLGALLGIVQDPKTTRRKAEPASVYELEVVLDDIIPPIWRRFTVSGDISLAKLSRAIQSVMGWSGGHLSEFVIGGQSYGDSNPELGIRNAERVRLREVAERPGTSFQYVYDFGDNWRHQVNVRSIRATQPGESVPQLLEGARACPPEDVGGIPGYEEFLRVMADPNDPEHDEMADWAGGDWDPEAFDLKAHRPLLAASIRNTGRGRGGWGPREI